MKEKKSDTGQIFMNTFEMQCICEKSLLPNK